MRTEAFEKLSLMVDIETLGKGPRSKIVSIGACVFNIDGVQDTFEVKIIQDEETPGTIDISTIMWWLNQDIQAIRATFDQSEAVPHPTALVRFRAFYNQYEPTLVWANGLIFDIPILEDKFGPDNSPWKYYQLRDMRTYRELIEALGLSRVKPTVSHSAVHDAIAQAQTLINVWRHLETLDYSSGETKA